MIVLKGRTYRGWLHHEGKALKDGVLALVEGLDGVGTFSSTVGHSIRLLPALLPSTLGRHGVEGAILNRWTRHSEDVESTLSPVLGSPAFRIIEMNISCLSITQSHVFCYRHPR